MEVSIKNIYDYLEEIPEKVKQSVKNLKVCYEKNNQKNKISKLKSLIRKAQEDEDEEEDSDNEWVTDAGTESSESDEEESDEDEDDYEDESD